MSAQSKRPGNNARRARQERAGIPEEQRAPIRPGLHASRKDRKSQSKAGSR